MKITIGLFVVIAVIGVKSKYAHPIVPNIGSYMIGIDFLDPDVSVTIDNEDPTIAIVDPPDDRMPRVVGAFSIGDAVIRPSGGKLMIAHDIMWCEGCTRIVIDRSGMKKGIHVAAYPSGTYNCIGNCHESTKDSTSDTKGEKNFPVETEVDKSMVDDKTAERKEESKQDNPIKTKYSGFNVETEMKTSINNGNERMEEFHGKTIIRTGIDRKFERINNPEDRRDQWCKNGKLIPGFDRDFVVIGGIVTVDGISFRTSEFKLHDVYARIIPNGCSEGKCGIVFHKNGMVEVMGAGDLEVKENEIDGWEYSKCFEVEDRCQLDVRDHWGGYVSLSNFEIVQGKRIMGFQKDIYINTGKERTFIFLGEKTGYITPSPKCPFVVKESKVTIDGFQFFDESGRGGVLFSYDGKVESLRGELCVVYPNSNGNAKTFSDVSQKNKEQSEL